MLGQNYFLCHGKKQLVTLSGAVQRNCLDNLDVSEVELSLL